MSQISRIFIGGLAWHTLDDTLKNKFQEFGEVEEAVIVKERNSEASRGFGFVKYTKAEDAAKAIEEMNGQIFDGRPIRVAYATDKQNSRPYSGGAARTGGGEEEGGGHSMGGIYHYDSRMGSGVGVSPSSSTFLSQVNNQQGQSRMYRHEGYSTVPQAQSWAPGPGYAGYPHQQRQKQQFQQLYPMHGQQAYAQAQTLGGFMLPQGYHQVATKPQGYGQTLAYDPNQYFYNTAGGVRSQVQGQGQSAHAVQQGHGHGHGHSQGNGNGQSAQGQDAATQEYDSLQLGESAFSPNLQSQSSGDVTYQRQQK